MHLLDRVRRPPKGAPEVTDLGFFDTDRFRAHTRRGVYGRTRLPARVSVRPGPSDPWVELAHGLERRKRRGAGDWDGTLEVAKISPASMRVVVRRCPPQDAARRRRQLRAQMKRHGQEPGWRQLALCDWWVLGTDTSVAQLSMSAATDVYRARWQIELAFKRWKSLGHLRVPEDGSASRAECEWYGRLLGVLVVDWLALLRGGPLSGTSVWAAWQIVRDLLGSIIRALAGRMDWDVVLGELADELKKLPKAPNARNDRARDNGC